MHHQVTIRKKSSRALKKLPERVRKFLFLLIEDLMNDGPIQKSWPNFSALANHQFHCHLNYRYVVCWTYNPQFANIEIYYVGSRENAPY